MGAHAGLVFVKVALRRAPLIIFSQHLPWWVHSDLRQSVLVHAFFMIIIILLLILYRGILFGKNTKQY
jgi:hypothetical protein